MKKSFVSRFRNCFFVFKIFVLIFLFFFFINDFSPVFAQNARNPNPTAPTPVNPNQNARNPNPTAPTPIDSNSGVNAENLNEAIGIFSAKCIFPHGKEDVDRDGSGTGGAQTACGVDESVVGILIKYLQNIIPYLAVLFMVYAGYVYYGSASSGSNQAAIKTMQGVAGGLILLLISNIVAGFFTTGQSKTGKTGLQILTGTSTTDQGSVLGFVTQSLLLPLFNMLQYAAGAFAVISFVYAGYLYIFSNMSGDSSMTKKAYTAIKNAAIGLLLVTLAVTITAFIQNYLEQFKTTATPTTQTTTTPKNADKTR